ncbi:MAG TPA: hypothetical protein VFA78_01630 [Chloroflexota bacterium]|nr:hypothetical protein [Chloroflexota bacterium]
MRSLKRGPNGTAVPRIALAVAGFLVLTGPFGSSTALSAPAFQTATPALQLSPNTGPAGSSVSISAYGFPADDTPNSATISFDGTAIMTTPFQQCNPQPGIVTGLGFGQACNGVAVNVTVPTAALPGSHTFEVSDPLRNSVRALFTVTPPATATPTPIPTSTPAPTPTATAVAASPCTTPSPSPITIGTSGTAGGQRLQGGATISLEASNLPASASLLLVFDGPRWEIQGTVATKIPYSAELGVAMTDAGGNLTTDVTLPADAMFGTARIEAFNRADIRSGPLYTWLVDTAPHDPWLDVTGPANTTFTVSPGLGTTQSSGSCTATTGSNGTVLVKGPIGLGTIHLLGNDGTPGDHLILGLPGEISHVDLGALAGITSNVPAACASNLEFLGLFDNLSGNRYVEDGIGPFGYFLHGVSVPETVLLTIGTKDGSPIPANCQPTLQASIRDTGGPFQQSLGTISPAPLKPDVDNFLSSLFPRADAIQEAMGTNTLVPELIKEIFTAFSSSSLNYLITLDPGKFSAGTGQLVLTMSGTPLISPTFQIIDPYWGSSQYHVDSGPSFDSSTRSYTSSGTVPQQALDYSWPQDFGWSKHGIIPKFDYHMDNSLQAGINVDETFTADGTWTASDAAVAKAVLVNQTIFDQSLPLSPSYDDPSAPSIVLNRTELGSGLHYHPNSPIVSFPIFGFSIPVVDISVGFTADVWLDADLDAYLDGTVNPDFSLNNLTLTGEGQLTLTATGGIDAGVGGVGAGISATLTLTIPVRYAPGSSPPVSVSPCLGGEIDFVVNWWYNVWFASDSGDFIKTPLASIHIPNGCSNAAWLSLRTELRNRARDLAAHAGSAAGASSVAASGSTAASSPRVSVDAAGREAAIWVRHDASRKRDLLMVATGRNGRWGRPRSIATSAAAILSPGIAELGNGHVAAVWIQNTLTQKEARALHRAKAPKIISAMLRHQELYAATFNRHAWQPRRLTHDALLDNAPTIAADTVHHSALVVWSRGANARSIALVASGLRGQTWTRPAVIAGSRGILPRGATLYRQATRYVLAYISGPAQKGIVHILAGSPGRWTSIPSPRLPAGATQVAVSGVGRELVLAAGVVTSRRKGRSAIWAATQAGSAWRRQRVTGNGYSPSLASYKREAILIFSRPDLMGTPAGTSQIADAVAPAGRPFSKVGLITGRPLSLGNPVAVANRSNTSLQIVYSRTPSALPAPLSPPGGWTLALNPAERVLDPSGGIVTSAVPLAAHPVADLSKARLSIAHPAPGTSVVLTVPIRNIGLVAGRLHGTISVSATGASLPSLTIARRLAANGSYKATATFAAPPAAISPAAHGIAATSPIQLGLPPTPAGLTAGTSPAGVTLTWETPSDSNVVQYRVYRAAGSGTFELVGLSDGTTFVDTTSPAKTSLRYAVTAVDAQGRESYLSAAAPVSTP